MTTRVTVLAMLAAACLAASAHGALTNTAPARSIQGAADADQIKDLAAEAGELAGLWIKDQQPIEKVTALARRIKSTTYDTASVAALSALLVKAKSTPEGIYVVNWLMNPLQLAQTDVIRKALPEVKKARQRLAHYGDPRQYNRSLPSSQGGALPEKSVAARKRLDELMSKLKQIQKGNQEAHTLNVATFKLMLLADQPAEDKALVALMKTYEQAGQWDYADVVEIIKSDARRLGPERAKMFYDALLEYGAMVRDKKAEYTAEHEMTVSEDKGGVAPKKSDYPGWRILKAVNMLAPVAGKPGVVVPRIPGNQPKGRRRIPRRQRNN